MPLIARELHFRHADDGPDILAGVNLTIEPGAIVGLTGPSGSGKTTLARILAGVRVPDAGTVEVDGTPVSTRLGRMDGRVGLLYQNPRTATDPRMSLATVIGEPLERASGRRRSLPDRSIATVAAQVGLTADLLQRFPGEVSDGQLQRACLARVLAAQPKYLICDEPTAMLDAAATASVTQLLRGLASKGVGVLVVSHDHRLLEAMAHRVTSLADLHGHLVN